MREVEFLDKALEIHSEQTNPDTPILAGGIARALRWRIPGVELDRFVRKLHSRGFILGTKNVAGGPVFSLDPTVIDSE